MNSMKRNFVLIALVCGVLVLSGSAMAQIQKDPAQVGQGPHATFTPLGGQHCSTTPIPIIDNNAAGTNGTIDTTAQTGTIADVNVQLQVTHTWVGDLRFTLSTDGPPVVSVVIIDRPGVPASTFGCANNDINVTLDSEGGGTPVEGVCDPGPPAISGNHTPNNPLTAFNGQDCRRVWTLNVSDHAGGDVGSVNMWCVDLNGCEATQTTTTTTTTTGGTGTPATSTWGVITLIALFMGVSLFYLRKRGSARA